MPSEFLAEQLFPPEVALVIASPEMWEQPLFAAEEQLIENAIEKRRREFRAGRHAAHHAIQLAGGTSGPILRGDQREPRWPAGYLGSISHCADLALALACQRGAIVGLGVDVEPLAPLAAGLERKIESDTESAFLDAHPGLPRRLVFSAKESLYKCYYPLVRRFFGFHEVELQITIETGQFSFRQAPGAKLALPAEPLFHGAYWITDKHLITGCYLTIG
ncbi:4'-phosphopantetheinyl transferase family protein [Candidatus Endoriftia persephonae]|jgi:4'-phosphopantetheinyl transferase EntD|uniref:Enterobactin synthase component D n=2 Tax=Gammaproteobacteria TaxID=1236 RepID=G2FBF3_9GAMM|nr:4'-phosphopantetheinyl transferase superfamily protein [Candidatus Endoriftia persephone]EGW56091.1 putative phosphopantetheinyl transferase PptA [endosymbiont of Tevnia jerichonana (vent Tica)]USF88207.1 4'-phosphopantetheinyl transferase superfamily protein [Candidatus Endoriftia persephone]